MSTAMSTPPTPSGTSAIDAAQQAIEHTRRHLFPFRFERWLVLGCVAFLDQCGRRTGLGGAQVPGPGSWGNAGRGDGEAPQALEWLAAHAFLVAGVAAAVLALVVALVALALWLNSRGVFMYVDNVATGRADFERPWREHAARAGSYFAWSFGLALATIGGALVLVVAGGVAVAMLVSGPPGSGLTAGLGLAGVVILLLALFVAATVASLALRDFVAPLQIEGNLACGAAVRLLAALVRAHPGAFLVYLLLKIVYGLLAAFVLLVSACITCCCVLLPVVTQTVLQPLFYFERAWPLFLLRQLGHDIVAKTGPSGFPSLKPPAI
jgi:hypothetical protein